MIEGKRVLAVIPARGGSKGIKNKNIRDLSGKPLIAYSILAGKQSKYIDRVVVSTDSEKIAQVAKEYGADVPFLRPAELASDTARTIDAILHCVSELKKQHMEYDVLVLLQPTQPLRTTEDIDRAMETFCMNGMESLVSVREVEEHPVLIRTIDETGTLKPLLAVNSTIRRQDMPKYYLVDGSIYINQIKEMNQDTSFNDNKIPYIMKAEHSVDIDEMRDLQIAELYLKEDKNHNGI